MRLSRLPHEVPEPRALLDRDVELPAEVADVRDPRGEHAQRAELEHAAGREREALVREVVARSARARMSRARGPQSPSVVQPLVRSVSWARPVRREVVGEPLAVRHPVRAARDDAEVLVAEPHDRQVGLEAAARREPAACRRPSRPARRSAASTPAGARRRAPGPATSKIAERGEVEHCRPLPHREVLGVDDRRPPAACPTRPRAGRRRSPNSSSSAAFDSYHCGRSQPAASKKTAPSSRSRSWNGDSRTSRFDPHCSSGWTIPYVLLNRLRHARAATCARVFWCSWKRAMSEACRSISDSPCVIHSASARRRRGPP